METPSSGGRKPPLVILLLALAGADCRRSPPPPPPPISHGFDPAQSRPSLPLSDAEREKLHRMSLPPPHFPERAQPPEHSLDLYVDEVRVTNLASDKLGPLTSLLPKVPVRSVLAHGDGGERWIPKAELGDYSVRLNRRGQLKLEWRFAEDPGGSGRHEEDDDEGRARRGKGDGSGRAAVPGSIRREHELRDLQWIEVRTEKSPRLTGE
jgi:hypothetical protein